MFSKSEQNGLNAILPDAQRIYSVGISTGGKAEVEMVKGNPHRRVIATTLDQDLTTYSSKASCYQRYFYTSESICHYIESAGFIIDSIQNYPEHLCSDFQRKKPAQHIDYLLNSSL